MPRNKDMKRLVRGRMSRTGESYTTARAQLLRKQQKKSGSPTAGGDAAVVPAAYARIAGHADDVLKAKTGCTWERWVRALDRDGARSMKHREIADLVTTKYGVGPWWTQAVAVGYERIRGLREVGQQRDGTYDVTRSRTFDVPVETLYRAWSDARTRKRWWNDGVVRVRTKTASKSIRLDWSEAGIVVAGFLSKGSSKSSVAVQLNRLPDRAAADRMRQYWTERLAVLGEVLKAG